LSGLLEDLEGGKTYVPEFNSLVAFNVPRDHVVTPVTGTRYARALPIYPY
jgi:Rps23 Pro-64 3,4-dihydroxylase Tpa1-like proline 4-hydroxylase